MQHSKGQRRTAAVEENNSEQPFSFRNTATLEAERDAAKLNKTWALNPEENFRFLAEWHHFPSRKPTIDSRTVPFSQKSPPLAASGSCSCTMAPQLRILLTLLATSLFLVFVHCSAGLRTSAGKH